MGHENKVKGEDRFYESRVKGRIGSNEPISFIFPLVLFDIFRKSQKKMEVGTKNEDRKY